MKSSKTPTKDTSASANLANVKPTSEEFPVFDFSVPSASEVAESDDFIESIEEQQGSEKDQALIKKHINNLWQELEHLGTEIAFLQQTLERFNSQQRQNKKIRLSAFLLIMCVALIMGGLKISTGSFVPVFLQDLVANEAQVVDRLTEFKLLNQRVKKLQSEQQQLQLTNTRLQNSLIELEQQLKPAMKPNQVLLTDQEMLGQTLNTKALVAENSDESAKWVVSLDTFSKASAAKKKARKFIAEQIPAIVSPININGETRYRIIIEGFENKQDALAYAQKTKKTHNLHNAWIARVK